MMSRDVPSAEASAAADPPPGVGSDELNAASASRIEVAVIVGSVNNPAVLDHGTNHVRADANEIDGRTPEDDGVHLLADFKAADAILTVERCGRIDRCSDQRLFEGESHPEARKRHREGH